MNFYVKLILIFLVVVGVAQFAPKAVNIFLLLILAGMVLVNGQQFAKLIAALKL